MYYAKCNDIHRGYEDKANMTVTSKKRYLLLISIHGLIRGGELELDSDTGGQTKYVIDLAKSLAERNDVERVDLVTRLVSDPAVSTDYAQPIEALSDKARIVRIEAGPEKYIAKEQLWDHLDSFTDNLVNWLNEQPSMPDLVHSHYADAGYVGVRLSNFLSVPLVHTGHSLGRDKRGQLLARGLSHEAIEKTYNIARRIDAEEEVLANADLVITSTRNEIDEQYGLYDYYNPAHMKVIPPGTDLELFHPPTSDETIAFKQQLAHFLKEPDKPIILALSRPDERKNILTLIEAYGESEALQQKANLLIAAGCREDIRDLDKGAQEVFRNILLLMDLYDLYGRMAIPKTINSNEVPQIYRLVASSKGVFINPALTEPFGLTILEAAASGLPVVATENGGPVDIIANCECGTLISPLDKAGITQALLTYLTNDIAWQSKSQNGITGVSKHYSWRAHTSDYMDKVSELFGKYEAVPKSKLIVNAFRYREHALYTDLDQSLIGDRQALEQLSTTIRENTKSVSFGIATGRRLDSALAMIKKYDIPRPDILISSLGTRIHYGRNLIEDDFWPDHIDHDWNADRIIKVLKTVPGLERQLKPEQSQHKISYFYDADNAPSQHDLVDILRQKEISANVILSFGQYLDIIPSRASKGQALRYVSQRLEIPLEQTLVAGGSGADEDMMRGNTLAVIVGNRHDEELSQLASVDNIFFAEQHHAAGILEAIEHYNFIDASRRTKNDR